MCKALSVLLLLGGCAANYTWEKEGSTQAQAYADGMQCYKDAAWIISDREIKLARLCCNSRYNEWESMLRTEIESRRNDFRQSCMLAKGYRMQRIAPVR